MVSKLNQVRVDRILSQRHRVTCPQLRNFMINTTDSWATTPMQVLNYNDIGIVFQKGDIVTVLTNIGSPVSLSRALALGRR